MVVSNVMIPLPREPDLLTEIISINISIRTWICDYIQVNSGMQFPILDVTSTTIPLKPPLKLGHGWLIMEWLYSCNYIPLYPCPKPSYSISSNETQGICGYGNDTVAIISVYLITGIMLRVDWNHAALYITYFVQDESKLTHKNTYMHTGDVTYPFSIFKWSNFARLTILVFIRLMVKKIMVPWRWH